jgi:DNA mismatch repair protein MutL
MMWRTTMNPETRRLIKVMPDDLSKTEEYFQPTPKTDIYIKEDIIINNEVTEVVPVETVMEPKIYEANRVVENPTVVLKEDYIKEAEEVKTEAIAEDTEDTKAPNLGLSDALLLGQAFNTYIILQKNNELYLVDQHAGHERVIYENIKKVYSDNSFSSQLLAMPQPVEVPGSEYRIAIENINFFEKLGFIYEDFGNNSLIVRSVPVVLTDTDYIQTLKDILDYISTNENKDFSIITDEALYQMACKAAVRPTKGWMKRKFGN